MDTYLVEKGAASKASGKPAITEIVGIILAESLDEAETIAKEKLKLQTMSNMVRDWLQDEWGWIHQIRPIQWINYPPSESQQISRLNQIQLINKLDAAKKEIDEKEKCIADIRRLVGTRT